MCVVEARPVADLVTSFEDVYHCTLIEPRCKPRCASQRSLTLNKVVVDIQTQPGFLPEIKAFTRLQKEGWVWIKSLSNTLYENHIYTGLIMLHDYSNAHTSTMNCSKDSNSSCSAIIYIINKVKYLFKYL